MTRRPPLLVVCALEIERRMLARTGLAVECCGPGAIAMRAWARRHERSERPVVLAGLAGGLVPDRPAGSAWVVTEVQSDEGLVWTPTLGSSDRGVCRVTSPSEIVATPKDKRMLARRSGADLADLESCAFARAATAAGWSWGIVRGVSDDATTALPPAVATWIDHRGRTRVWRVAAGLARRPTLVPTLLRLQSASRTALRSVNDRLDDLG